jgi:hypothetical protein
VGAWVLGYLSAGYPRYSDLGDEKLHPWNIKVVYQQLKKQA